VLFAGTLINRTGGFVLIFLAIYLAEGHGLSADQAGAIVSAYGLGAIAAGPLGGALSDRVGRRPTLVVSLVAGGASLFVLGLATDLAAIAVAAVITGLLYEMYRPVVSAAVADVVPPDDRPRAYGLIYWAVNLGGSFAAVFGGVIASRSYRALFAIDAITTALFGLVLWAALPETRPTWHARDEPRGSTLRMLLGDRAFVALCLLTFALFLVFFQVFVGLPIDMRAHGVSTVTFGWLMAINGILIVLLQLPVSDLIARRSRTRMLALSALTLGVGFGMNGWIGSVPAYALSITVWTAGELLCSPAGLALVVDLAPSHARGLYQGAYSVAFTAAFATAPLVGGYIIAHAGAQTLWAACLGISVAVAAGFLALSRAERRYDGRRKSPT
jgi:predicted MFS family arabinose efflux permease